MVKGPWLLYEAQDKLYLVMRQITYEKKIREDMKLQEIRIVVVDDHPVISHGIKSVLGKDRDFEIVGEADTAKDAENIIGKTKPDVVVLDITLEGGDGVSLLSKLHEISPKTKTVMYTMHSDTVYIARSFQAGALGYVLKSDQMAELVDAIKDVYREKIYLSSSIPQTILTELMMGKRSAENPVDGLTAREFEIASLIAQGEKVENIAKKLHISPKTVRVHRTNIMHKFSCNHVHELLLQLRQYFPQ